LENGWKFVTVHGFKDSGFFLASFPIPVWSSMCRQPVRIRRFKQRIRLSNGNLLPKRSGARFKSARCCCCCPKSGDWNPEPVNAYSNFI